MADLIPKDKIAVRPFVEIFTRLPTVQFTKDGVTYVANLWDVDDQAYVEIPVVNAGRSGDTPWVTVTLKVAMADRPNDPITVAKGRWRTETIAGGQIHATFVPVAGSPEELLALPPRHFTSFLPTLRVAHSDGEAFGSESAHNPSQAKVLTGDPFTLDGRVFEDRSDNWSPRSGRVGRTGKPDRIASLQITRVVDGHFPWIGLDVEAKDGQGKSVPEVPLQAFQVEVDSGSAPMFIEHNMNPIPRVLFLLDVSTSVADEFRGGAAKGLVQTIARTIRKGSPKSQFRVGLVSGSGASLLSWRDKLEDLNKDVGHFGMGSPLWRAAGEVSEAGASAVVFITDGHAADRDGPILEPDEVSERLIRAGPPFVMISAVKPDQTAGPAIQTLADLTGGVVVNIDQPGRVADRVIQAIQQQSAPYRFWVRADQEKDSHEVKLGLTDGKIDATVLVPRPSPNVRSFLPGPVGLYLTVEANRVVSERTLAGHPYRSNAPVSDSAKTDTWLGLFGQYTVFAEAGIPNSVQILDDLISARLSWEPVIEADTVEEGITALGQAWRLPPSAFMFSVPLPQITNEGNAHRVVDYGLRWWIHSSRHVQRDGKEYQRESVDLLPNTRFFSTDPEPHRAFKQTLLASSFLTDIEAALYPHNALRSLRDTTLTFTGRYPLTEVTRLQKKAFKDLTSGWRYPYHFVMPGSGAAHAGVAVDMSSGTALGLLGQPGATGKGGGITEEEANRRFDLVDQLLDAVSEVGGAPGAWAKVQKASMGRLRVATIAIIRMEPPDLLGELREHACSEASDAMGSAAEAGIRLVGGGVAGTVLDALDDFSPVAEGLGLGGLEPPVSIPGCE